MALLCFVRAAVPLQGLVALSAIAPATPVAPVAPGSGPMITAILLVSQLLGAGQAAPPSQGARPVGLGVRYHLLPGSTMVDLDLPGSPPRELQGTFWANRLQTAAPFPTWRLRRLELRTGGGPSVQRVAGAGYLHRFGQFPGGSQQMDLVLSIDGGPPFDLHSGVVPQEVRWETIEIIVRESASSPSHAYELTLIAEPRRMILFSTEVGMTSAGLGPIADGDLLSSLGGVVRTNGELTEPFEPVPSTRGVGLDALGLTPATASVLFSGEIDVSSQSLGVLQHGDLLNEHGFVAQTNQELTEAFLPQPVVPDAGLDAFHFDLETGELWFSLESPLFSELLGATLQPGDLLSASGQVVKTHAELLARFDIVDPDPGGYGLDAVTRRRDGTILFSVEQDFRDARLGPVGHGDVLSDNGHVVLRHLDLVAPLQPLEDLDDFGLDALQVPHP